MAILEQLSAGLRTLDGAGTLIGPLGLRVKKALMPLWAISVPRVGRVILAARAL